MPLKTLSTKARMPKTTPAVHSKSKISAPKPKIMVSMVIISPFRLN